MLTAAAWLYALLALVVIVFQFALAAGAPWGHLAMGGRHPGRLPPKMRFGAVVQAALQAAFAFVLLGRVGAVSPEPPMFLVWVVVAISGLGAVLNLITPSIPERRLWGPVALVMFICAVRVALG